MRFADPTNDMAFKKIFGDDKKKNILISFLNVMLDLSAPIADIQILSPLQQPIIDELKFTILDVRAKDTLGRDFIVEMQVEGDNAFGKRAIYYTAKSYVNQINIADHYRELKPVIFLGILNFRLFDGDNPITRHIIINKEVNRRDLEDLEWNFIELPKFVKKESELTTIIDKWLYFMKHASDLIVIPPNVTDPALIEAYEVIEQFKWSKEELNYYDRVGLKRGADKSVEITALERGHKEGLEKGLKEGLEKGLEKGLKEGLEKGLEKGIEKGIEKGLKEGLEKGLEKGRHEQALLMAKNMLQNGFSLEDVIKITGLSYDDIG